MAKIALIDRIVKAMAEHHCEATNQQMVNKTVKLGTESTTPMVAEKITLTGLLCKAAAEIYAEENNLELTSTGK